MTSSPTHLHHIRSRIAFWWIALSIPLLLLVFMQTILGKYGDGVTDSLTGLGWVFQQTLPACSMMVAPLLLNTTSAAKSKQVDNSYLISILYALMILYFVILYSIILLEPFTRMKMETILLLSGWFLTPIQGIIIGVLTKFFIEGA